MLAGTANARQGDMNAKDLQDRDIRSNRTIRLLLCAFCRQNWSELVDARSKRAVTMAERWLLEGHGDGACYAYRQFMNEAHMAVQDALRLTRATTTDRTDRAFLASQARDTLANGKVLNTNLGIVFPDLPIELLADIVSDDLPDFAGDPVLAPQAHEMLTNHVIDGKFAPLQMAILGDLAERRGLPESLIDHLRQPGPHYFGCWALERICGFRRGSGMVVAESRPFDEDSGVFSDEDMAELMQ